MECLAAALSRRASLSVGELENDGNSARVNPSLRSNHAHPPYTYNSLPHGVHTEICCLCIGGNRGVGFALQRNARAGRQENDDGGGGRILLSRHSMHITRTHTKHRPHHHAKSTASISAPSPRARRQPPFLVPRLFHPQPASLPSLPLRPSSPSFYSAFHPGHQRPWQQFVPSFQSFVGAREPGSDCGGGCP